MVLMLAMTLARYAPHGYADPLKSWLGGNFKFFGYGGLHFAVNNEQPSSYSGLIAVGQQLVPVTKN